MAMNREILYAHGIDVEKGVSRCMGDAAFYERLLNLFLQDASFRRGEAAYAAKDYKALFSCMHELKGVAGSAAMNDLYDAVCPLVETLRRGDAQDAQIDRLFPVVESAYERVCEGVALSIQV